jgi:hypothetical protein
MSMCSDFNRNASPSDMDIRALVGTNSPSPLPHFDPEFSTSKAVKVQLLNTVITHANASLPHFSVPRMRTCWSPNREQASWALQRLLGDQPDTKEAAVGLSIPESRDPLESEVDMWERDGDLASEISPCQLLNPRGQTLKSEDKHCTKGYNKTISKLVNTISPGRPTTPLKPKSPLQSTRRPSKIRPRPLSTRPTPSSAGTSAPTPLPMKITGRPWLYPAPIARPKTAIATGRPRSHVVTRSSRTASVHRGLSSGTDLDGMTDSFSPLMLKPKYATQSKDFSIGEVRVIDVKIPTPKFRHVEAEEGERRPYSAMEIRREWEQTPAPSAESSIAPTALATPYVPPDETEQSSPDKMSIEALFPPRFTITSSKRSSEVPRPSETDPKASLAVAMLKPARFNLISEPVPPHTASANLSLLISRVSPCYSPANMSDLVNSMPAGVRPRSGIVRHGRLIKGKVALEGVRTSGRAVRCVHLID